MDDARLGPHAIKRPQPLGPDSLMWRYFGDWRGMLIGPWAGVMQNLHPAIGAAVQEHSSFFGERWERLFRSIYPINGVVFDGARAFATAREIRNYHRDIKGTDSAGRTYHALNPGPFYWAHATFFMATVLVAEKFMGGLTADQRRQLHDEHVRWYSLYGMTLRNVPVTWDDFLVYWKRMCVETLEDNPAARGVLDLEGLAPPPALRGFPRSLWRVLWPTVAKAQRWMTVGLFDPEVRTLLGYRWTRCSALLHRLVCALVRVLFNCLPRRRRLHPRARSAWDRATGRIAPDSPLVETPARNLPPKHGRNNPKHYCPVRQD